MDDYEPSEPPTLRLKKWTGVIVAIVMLGLSILFASLAYTLSWKYLYDYETFSPHYAEEAKIKVIVILVLLSLYNGAVSIIGIIASINQNMHMISVYAILLVVAFVLNLINSIVRPYYFVMPFWSLVQLCTCALHAHGVYDAKRQNNNMFSKQKQLRYEDFE